jgi:hypothetical protein
MKKTLLCITAALFVPIGMAHASGPPEAKEGLWSVNRQIIQVPGNKKDLSATKICISHAHNQYVEGLAKNMTSCTTVSESTQGNKYSKELRCVVGKTVIDTKGTTTMLGDTTTHTESHIRPSLPQRSETARPSRSAIRSTWGAARRECSLEIG